jgi:hypothetical protein
MAIKVGNIVQAKVGTAAYTDTSAKALFTLPANAMVINVYALGVKASSGTSGTYSLKSRPVNGSSAAATFATIDAYATNLDTIPQDASLAGIAYSRQSEPQYVTVTYADGTGSAAEGSVTIVVEYL